jgi:hypothetical protein
MMHGVYEENLQELEVRIPRPYPAPLWRRQVVWGPGRVAPPTLLFGCSQTSKMPCPPLPEDLWNYVLDRLQRTDLRTCLFVSRELHTLSVARLFRVVHIHLGVPGAARAMNVYSNDVRDHWLAREVDQTERMSDILDAIMAGGVFARAVKKLAVHAEHARHGCVMERSASQFTMAHSQRSCS